MWLRVGGAGGRAGRTAAGRSRGTCLLSAPGADVWSSRVRARPLLPERGAGPGTELAELAPECGVCQSAVSVPGGSVISVAVSAGSGRHTARSRRIYDGPISSPGL